MAAPQTPARIACCRCARPTLANVTIDGHCFTCIAETVDASEGIGKEYELEMCGSCSYSGIHRWYRNPQWVIMEPESAELLSFCIRRIRGLKQVRLVDASWIWQEPHSRRLKVKLTVAREVLSGHSLEQSFIVDYTVCTQWARMAPALLTTHRGFLVHCPLGAHQKLRSMQQCRSEGYMAGEK